MTSTALVGGQEFFIHREGAGDPLLFIHGFPLDHTMWRHQIEYFAKSHLVIAPDLRGFGRSRGEGASTSMRQFADDLIAILDAIGIDEPVNVCGLSMGGYICWQLVQNYRSRLRSLILCDTKASSDSEDTKKTRHETAKKVLSEGPAFIAEAMAEKLFSEKTRGSQNSVVEETQEVIRGTRPASIASALQGMAERPDMTFLLNEISLPTLVIVGEDDVITPAEEMKSIAETIPNAIFKKIADAGHMAPLEQPAEVNAAMAEFLAD